MVNNVSNSKRKIFTHKVIIILIVVLFFIAVIGGIIAIKLTAPKAGDPKNVLDKYISSWDKKDYNSMYVFLSTDSKTKINKNDYYSLNNGIYTDISANNIKVTANYPNDFDAKKNNQIHIPISVSLDTVAGSYNYTYEINLVKENVKKQKKWYTKIVEKIRGKETEWCVTWNKKMIFPQLESDDKIIVDHPKDLKAKRGEIRDRNDKPLAVNAEVVSIGVVPQSLTADAKSQLANILGISVNQIDSKLSASWVRSNLFVPIQSILKDKTDLIKRAVALPGVQKQDVNGTVRTYPLEEAAAHLTGYVGTITDKELADKNNVGYSKDDVIGKAGLEQVFEKRLRGQNGIAISTADAKGNKKVTILRKAGKDGEDIRLTIDSDVQQSIYNQMSGDAGAAVAVQPKTGEVLALVSTPAYDPNFINNGMSNAEYNELNSDPKKPWTNKFTSAYSPGSTFKMITAAIGLKTSKLDPAKEEDIKGKTWQPSDGSFGSYAITRVDDPGKPENLLDAFVYSDNIYFAKTALAIGKDDFTKEAKNFGFGEDIPFGYPMQKSQISNDGTISKATQLADSGYGQGQILMTPLHLSMIYSSLVNDGNILTPILETKDRSSTPKIWHENVYSSDISKTILQDLTQVIENPAGTGHAAQTPGVALAGKTGTPQIQQVQNDVNGKENGWFTVMNTENPKLEVTMMIEDAKDKGGSAYVVPKAANVMRQFLK
ncbi:MAG: penicillin-binding transpeptidase domain-containing protein [Bacillota bacterium]|nr:penicillin-binding transpeptidase domain-containing protein [Bacillota bacterium]